MKIFSKAVNQPWAITEGALRTILEIADVESRGEIDVQAVEARLGRRLDNTRLTTVRDGVASIPIEGPIFRYANLFTEISGASSVEIISRDFQAAMDNPAVHSIILVIDSPGGEVTGINEFAGMVRDARGKKPVIAYVDGDACSAAYWIASAADEIVADATATLGSIGTVLTVRDPSTAKATTIEFVSSQSPNKRPNPTTESGRTQLQRWADDLADVFIETIATNRDVTAEQVLADFGQGGVMVGKHAVTAGLADRLGSYEGVLSELVARHQDKQRPGGANRRAAMSDENTTPAGDELAQLRAQLDEMKKANATLQEGLLREQAASWASSLVVSHQIMPAEQGAFAELFAVLALDDAQSPRTITLATAEGGQVTVNRVGLLKHAAAQRPAHKLTTEAVQQPVPTTPPAQPANGNPSAANGGQQPAGRSSMTAERRAELLGKTPVGQDVLEQRKN